MWYFLKKITSYIKKQRNFVFLLIGVLLGFIVGFSLPASLNDKSVNNSPALVLQSPSELVQQSFGDTWEQIITKNELSSVAIQAFSGHKLIRSGSGFVLSVDGIILTTADVAPIKSAVYQIAIDNHFVQGVLVAQDIQNNLALLKADFSGSSVARIETDGAYTIGQECILIGKRIELSQDTIFAQRGMISYSLGKTRVIDTQFSPYLSGARVIDHKGHLLGITYLRNGKVLFVDSLTVDMFFRNYLKSLTG